MGKRRKKKMTWQLTRGRSMRSNCTVFLSVCCLLIGAHARNNIFDKCIKGKDRRGNACLEEEDEDYFGNSVRNFFQSMNTEAPGGSPAPTVAGVVGPSASTGPTSTSSPTPSVIVGPSTPPTATNTNSTFRGPTTTSRPSPSQSPPPSITAHPSHSPNPSLSPSPTGTVLFMVPTTSMSPTETSAPTSTLTPSFTPSFSPDPTIFPKPSTSMAPSSAPSITMTPTSSSMNPPSASSPSSPNCTVDGRGTFGSTAVSDRVVVDFAYQLETVARTNLSVIFPPLERSFNDELLPSLFEAQCGTDNAKRFLKRRRRRLTLLGISPLPRDVPLANVNCTDTEAAGSDCSVVKGELTVFHDGTTTSDSLIRRTRLALRLAMTAGAFDRAHQAIERVSYVELDSTATSSAGPEDGASKSAGGGNNPVIWGVIAGVLSLVFIMLALLWRKRRRDDEEEDSELLAETREVS